MEIESTMDLRKISNNSQKEDFTGRNIQGAGRYEESGDTQGKSNLEPCEGHKVDSCINYNQEWHEDRGNTYNLMGSRTMDERNPLKAQIQQDSDADLMNLSSLQQSIRQKGVHSCNSLGHNITNK